jgi:hypothetical protein
VTRYGFGHLQRIADKAVLHTKKFVKPPTGRVSVHLQQTSNDCICPDDKLTTRQ